MTARTPGLLRVQNLSQDTHRLTHACPLTSCQAGCHPSCCFWGGVRIQGRQRTLLWESLQGGWQIGAGAGGPALT